MKYIKTYEALTQKEKEEIKRSKNEPYKTFIIDNLRHDSLKYDINFVSLLKEIMLNRKILFECVWCYNGDIEYYVDSIGHSVIGKCIDIKHSDEGYGDSDILVKIEGYENWHTLYSYNPTKNKRVRVFYYKEGNLMQKLEMRKNTEKYNL